MSLVSPGQDFAGGDGSLFRPLPAQRFAKLGMLARLVDPCDMSNRRFASANNQIFAGFNLSQ
ncbi:MAG: hypothetical protein OXE51_07690 [Gammaproteobacteria bacterium]|nr:hypothetical protein [Gammaproteobacteria bacterium]